MRLVRLKDKLGNRSNASSEVEFDGALGFVVGEPGRGIATILEMVRHTRLDCVLGTAGMMRARARAGRCIMRSIAIAFGRAARRAAADAQRPCRSRARGRRPQPRSRCASRAHSKPSEGSAEHALARVLTPAAKYWICKRGPPLAAEAMEVLGGNGYVEENPLPRVYREMPVNSIWEGSGNVIALDVLRALSRDGDAREALQQALAAAAGTDARFDDGSHDA